jgi:hypothetical protein
MTFLSQAAQEVEGHHRQTLAGVNSPEPAEGSFLHQLRRLSLTPTQSASASRRGTLVAGQAVLAASPLSATLPGPLRRRVTGLVQREQLLSPAPLRRHSINSPSN